jgi:phosphate transport system substrate-binding protein
MKENPLMTRHSLRRAAAAALGVAALGIAALGGPVRPETARADQVTLTISGSTQMYTLGQLMATKYMSTHPGLQINVNPTSSQFGFDNSCSGSIDIGMSDVYIQDKQIGELGCGDMVGIPIAVSATPVIYNLPGASFNQKQSDGFTLAHPVKLTASVLSDIYSCKVTRWNDPAIAGLNKGLTLPAQNIRVATSSEPGGSGFVFDQWLAYSIASWNSKVGVGLQPAWPCGIGQPSSGTMIQYVTGTPYSIGFAGFDYAITNHVQTAMLRNASGVYQNPSLNGLSYAIERALRDGFPHDFRKSFVLAKDPGGSHHSFNPADFEFFTVHSNMTSGTGTRLPAVRQAIKAFLTWCIAANGGQAFIASIELHKIGKGTQTELAHGFVPVPKEVRDTIAHTVDQIKV